MEYLKFNKIFSRSADQRELGHLAKSSSRGLKVVSLRILIADDNPISALILATLIRLLLSEKGVRPKLTVVCTGLGVLEKLSKQARKNTRHDIVILRYRLTMIPVRKIVAAIRKAESTRGLYVPVICVTDGTIGRQRELAAFKAGVDMFLRRPFSKTDLLEKISIASQLDHSEPPNVLYW